MALPQDDPKQERQPDISFSKENCKVGEPKIQLREGNNNYQLF
jgi:hypothetical protein